MDFNGGNTENLQDTTHTPTQCVGGIKKIGYCLHCAKEFEKNTAWQKYCNDACRQEAYEQRTGKKLHTAIKPKLDKA